MLHKNVYNFFILLSNVYSRQHKSPCTQKPHQSAHAKRRFSTASQRSLLRLIMAVLYHCCALSWLCFIMAVLYHCCALSWLCFIMAVLYDCCALSLLCFIIAVLYDCCALSLLCFQTCLVFFIFSN
jgi:hypothetical protein